MVSGLVLAIALFALVAATTIQIRSTREGVGLSGHDQPRRTPPDPRLEHGGWFAYGRLPGQGPAGAA